MPDKRFKKRYPIILLILLLILLVFLVSLMFDAVVASIQMGSLLPFQERFADMGMWSFLLIALGQFLLLLSTFIPATPVHLMAGVLFDPLTAMLSVGLGMITGYAFIFLLVKSDIFKAKKKKAEALNEDESISLWIFFMTFAIPVLPYGLIAFVMIKKGVSFKKYMPVTVFGSVPSALAAIYFGDAMTRNFGLYAPLFVLFLLFLLLLNGLTTALRHRNLSYVSSHVRKQNWLLYEMIFFLTKRHYHVEASDLGEIGKKGPQILIADGDIFNSPILYQMGLYPRRVHVLVDECHYTSRNKGYGFYQLGALMYKPEDPDGKLLISIQKLMDGERILLLHVTQFERPLIRNSLIRIAISSSIPVHKMHMTMASSSQDEKNKTRLTADVTHSVTKEQIGKLSIDELIEILDLKK
ncbi:MAG: TVP38/TMEM64 family protein [Acholeplasmataceae bacterium]|nr:TVP38/TMEM64 family protein [Acholeplasmataceae bacterium]